MKDTKKEKERKSVLITGRFSQARQRIAFRDYAKKKEKFSLIVDFIFLPVKFNSYGLLLTDGNDEYRIAYNIRPKIMEKVFTEFGLTIGKNYIGKVLIVKKENDKIFFEEGEEEATYVWMPGKGWRLSSLEAEDIPF